MSPEIRGGLADFFRNASEAHRKEVFEEVLKKATEAQLETLRQAKEITDGREVPGDKGSAPEAV